VHLVGFIIKKFCGLRFCVCYSIMCTVVSLFCIKMFNESCGSVSFFLVLPGLKKVFVNFCGLFLLLCITKKYSTNNQLSRADHHHHHISVMELGHLLTRSVLTYSEVS